MKRLLSDGANFAVGMAFSLLVCMAHETWDLWHGIPPVLFTIAALLLAAWWGYRAGYRQGFADGRERDVLYRVTRAIARIGGELSRQIATMKAASAAMRARYPTPRCELIEHYECRTCPERETCPDEESQRREVTE